MNILIIDNNSVHIGEIESSFYGHNVEIKHYSEHSVLDDSNLHLIILSGGSGHGAYDLAGDYRLWFQNELDLIASTKVPIIGICMGFELICIAFNQRLVKLAKPSHGRRLINFTGLGQKFFGTENITAYEAHSWAIEEVDETIFTILGASKSGIEAINHKKLPILGMQFHPEATKANQKLLNQLAQVLINI